jgi:branched-chain amino acid transport system ATP-binding protein
MTALLEVDRVSKSYGALRAADEVSFTVTTGETLGIIGPNGAGKTTLFNLIGGDARPDVGRIRLAGRDITALAPHERCRIGIGRTYQVPYPFDGMTVFENLLVAAAFGGGKPEQAASQVAARVIRRTGLAGKGNELAGSLTLLDRKRLELARALSTEPKLLLLDEIAGGLTEPEARELVELVRWIGAQGVTIIWIEHVVHALLAVATRLLVMNFGATLTEGHPHKVMASPEVKRVYMGIEPEEAIT